MTSELTKPKKRKKRRAYPPKYREERAELARKNKPWKYSTGPNTPEGKAKTRKNAVKHGFRSEEMRDLRRILRLQRDFVRSIFSGQKPENGGYSAE